jgi:hypothetical protein
MEMCNHFHASSALTSGEDTGIPYDRRLIWKGDKGQAQCTTVNRTAAFYTALTELTRPLRTKCCGLRRVELLLICDGVGREPCLKPNGMQILLIPASRLKV